MCHWMGSHFHDWIDYHGVAFSIELLEWGRIFRVRQFFIFTVSQRTNNNNNSNELYLHDHERDLHRCKSILTMTKSQSNNNVKLLIINCLAFLNRMIRIVLIAC